VAALLLGFDRNGVYNIGTGRETTILATLHTLERIAGKTAKTKFIPGIAGELSRSAADVKKAKEELGWVARVALRDGIKKILSMSG
jgi:nucleoside-diphosphate-sugar epimerase